MFVFAKKTAQATLFSMICILLAGCGEAEAPQPVPDIEVPDIEMQERQETSEEPLIQSEDKSSENEISGGEISEEEPLFCKSEYKGTHPYVSGWRVDGSTGQTTPVYSGCGVSINYYKTTGEWVDGSGEDTTYSSKVIHSSCGK